MQNYMSYTPSGWCGRGVEFATQPFDLPRREMVELNRMFDTTAYRRLPAKSKIATRFILFYVKSPEGMSRVDDVRLENGKIIVEDCASGKTLTLAASLRLSTAASAGRESRPVRTSPHLRAHSHSDPAKRRGDTRGATRL